MNLNGLHNIQKPESNSEQYTSKSDSSMDDGSTSFSYKLRSDGKFPVFPNYDPSFRACSATDPDPDPELIPESKIPYIEVRWNSGISGNAWGLCDCVTAFTLLPFMAVTVLKGAFTLKMASPLKIKAKKCYNPWAATGRQCEKAVTQTDHMHALVIIQHSGSAQDQDQDPWPNKLLKKKQVAVIRVEFIGDHAGEPTTRGHKASIPSAVFSSVFFAIWKENDRKPAFEQFEKANLESLPIHFENSYKAGGRTRKLLGCFIWCQGPTTDKSFRIRYWTDVHPNIDPEYLKVDLGCTLEEPCEGLIDIGAGQFIEHRVVSRGGQGGNEGRKGESQGAKPEKEG
ncbi:hypothetical protein EV361DRAFT_864171 [Lentinula raphanica]|nr:hypothetical protein EV361DRAFT_864171 [Lentinula raphanica]